MIRAMGRAAIAALTLGAGSLHAGPLEVEAGAAAVMFDTPSDGAAEAFDTRTAAAITATLSPDAKFPVGIRLHGSIGWQGSGLRSLGFAIRQRTGRLVIDTGLGIASIVGVLDAGMSESLRPRALGLTLDVRIGYSLGPVVIAAFALPAYVIANDSFAPEARVRSALEMGVTLARSL